MREAWDEGSSEKASDALRVIVAGDDAGARAAAAKAIEIAGGRLVAEIPLAELGERLDRQVALDLVMLELAGRTAGDVDRAIEVLLTSAHGPDADGVPVIVTIDMTQIDPVSARLHGARVILQCTPTLAERTGAITVVREPRGGAALSDLTRESEQERLRRLDEDVARIADALARLTGRDPTARREEEGAGGVTLHERPLAYGAPPVASIERPVMNELGLAARVRAAIKARRLRDQFFDGSLFADPAWDMLLDLFAARLEHARVSVSSLCIAAAVPPTTALRWISSLSEAGLLVRDADPLDKRRAFIGLSGEAAEGMRNYMAAVDRTGLAIA